MNNFQFQNTTKIIFGRGEIAQLSRELPRDKKILVVMGGGSIKTNGVYDQVVKALEGFDYLEFWGVEPNPKVETLRRAVEIGKREGVGFVLAVGGGSVLDGTKLIANAILSQRDAWDIIVGGGELGESLPFASVMTLPATGSEMNRGAVISCEATKEKLVFYSYYPQFSILDPDVPASLPKYQIACGIADSFVHTFEQYLTDVGVSPLMDRWSEGILQTLVESAPKVLANPKDYASMSDFMLSATMALNGFIAMGVPQDWASHRIGQEITAFVGLTHGETLAIVTPALMRVMKRQKWAKLLQYGERVWGIVEGDESSRVDAAIDATESFFRSLGLKTRLAECGIGQDVADLVVERMRERGSIFGEGVNIDYRVAKDIFALCAK